MLIRVWVHVCPVATPSLPFPRPAPLPSNSMRALPGRFKEAPTFPRLKRGPKACGAYSPRRALGSQGRTRNAWHCSTAVSPPGLHALLGGMCPSSAPLGALGHAVASVCVFCRLSTVAVSPTPPPVPHSKQRTLVLAFVRVCGVFVHRAHCVCACVAARAAFASRERSPSTRTPVCQW